MVKLLNTYYQSMNHVIREHEGVVNQFVGDEIFVTFGAPVSIPHCEEKAVYCALGMIQQLKLLNTELMECLQVEIKVGIGINYGPVIAGNLGSDDKIEYSKINDGSLKGSGSFSVYAANNRLNIMSDKPTPVQASFTIFDESGRQLAKRDIILRPGLNSVTGLNLGKGNVVFVQLRSDEGSKIFKVIR